MQRLIVMGGGAGTRSLPKAAAGPPSPGRLPLQVSQRTADGMWVALACGALLQLLVYLKAPDIITCEAGWHGAASPRSFWACTLQLSGSMQIRREAPLSPESPEAAGCSFPGPQLPLGVTCAGGVLCTPRLLLPPARLPAAPLQSCRATWQWLPLRCTTCAAAPGASRRRWL